MLFPFKRYVELLTNTIFLQLLEPEARISFPSDLRFRPQSGVHLEILRKETAMSILWDHAMMPNCHVSRDFFKRMGVYCGMISIYPVLIVDDKGLKCWRYLSDVFFWHSALVFASSVVSALVSTHLLWRDLVIRMRSILSFLETKEILFRQITSSTGSDITKRWFIWGLTAPILDIYSPFIMDQTPSSECFDYLLK